ncbi:putative integral membrane protein [Beutenbergia cavernae DSM 12333]|uniref:Putative integral membrane protein n=1 Tax=Beutenbergia cavernae (strain ATCC BAA-8 / DSM 12333 / CCUG 43141 / JCM 11478 / NBRC 16432 / NCIMB 13614 / HKI 0122) TaxID=471853 RepID=C5C504_BEUC1|nr:putative integral membrane protein [Beutenbergia cavernae DSM 12333]
MSETGPGTPAPHREAPTPDPAGTPSGTPHEAVHDPRRRAYGAGRALIAVYGVFALSATARAGVQLVRDAAEAPLAYGLSAFSALVYVVATIALAHNGHRMRRVAWAAVVVELVGVLAVGTLSVVDPAAFPKDTVWSHFGQGYGFVPLVLPLLGLAWLWRSSPARIAQSDR